MKKNVDLVSVKRNEGQLTMKIMADSRNDKHFLNYKMFLKNIM